MSNISFGPGKLSMREPTKETLCSKCLHLNVCKYRDDFLLYLEQANRIRNDEGSIYRTVHCNNHYQKENPLPLHRELIQPMPPSSILSTLAKNDNYTRAIHDSISRE